MDDNTNMAQRYEHEIPEGYEARIEGNKVIIELKETVSEDEATRRQLVGYLKCDKEDHPERSERIDKFLAYLEKQKDEAQKQFNLGVQAGREEVMYEMEKEQKPAEWSEEDKHRLEQAIKALSKNGYFVLMAWLKLLPERFNIQPKKEWSEEDERNLYNIIGAIKYTFDVSEGSGGSRLIAWLKFHLCLQSHWKPSEEQMKQLKTAADLPEFGPMVTTRKQFPDLETLYNDLLKNYNIWN